MEKFSGVEEILRVPLEIPLPDYLQDHRFMGKAVFPAVEAMRVLAVSVRSAFPEIRTEHMSDARFDKFIPLSPGQRFLSAFHEVEISKGRIISGLLTRFRSEKSGISRMKAHVILRFSAGIPEKKEYIPRNIPEDTDVYEIPAEKIYGELVPFGPHYQNIINKIRLTEKMAVADVQGGPSDFAVHFPESATDFSADALGSPFPLDAAFHTACVWSQRYAGITAFPVAFRTRHIYHPARIGEIYQAYSLPLGQENGMLSFDIYLCDRKGNLCERVEGVQMRDVSGGRLKPPEWIVR